MRRVERERERDSEKGERQSNIKATVNSCRERGRKDRFRKRVKVEGGGRRGGERKSLIHFHTWKIDFFYYTTKQGL